MLLLWFCNWLFEFSGVYFGLHICLFVICSWDFFIFATPLLIRKSIFPRLSETKNEIRSLNLPADRQRHSQVNAVVTLGFSYCWIDLVAVETRLLCKTVMWRHCDLTNGEGDEVDSIQGRFSSCSDIKLSFVSYLMVKLSTER